MVLFCVFADGSLGTCIVVHRSAFLSNKTLAMGQSVKASSVHLSALISAGGKERNISKKNINKNVCQDIRCIAHPLESKIYPICLQRNGTKPRHERL